MSSPAVSSYDYQAITWVKYITKTATTIKGDCFCHGGVASCSRKESPIKAIN